jgi:hypothetical protein
MSFLPDFFEKVKNCFALSAGFVENLAFKKKQRVLILFSTAALVLFVIILVLVFGSHGKEPRSSDSAAAAPTGQRKRPAEENYLRSRASIPSEELFLPEEPDFVPGVLLERERRTSWTANEAAPFWQNPLKDGEEKWRERIENVIDEFLEHIP